VLSLLKENESEQLSKARAAFAVKKEDPADVKGGGQSVGEDVCENLRTVEFEAISYLSAPFQPTNAQSGPRIHSLIQRLSEYPLTKAEKLQIANLAPTQPVELYVIVEEFEDRLNSKMDEILAIVQESLSVSELPPHAAEDVARRQQGGNAADGEQDLGAWDYGQPIEEEPVYVEEGAFEGDLDMEED